MRGPKFHDAWRFSVAARTSGAARLPAALRLSSAVVLLSATALLAACSGIPLKQRQDAQRARYEAYAGPPVERFTYLGRYDSWQPVGTNELVVWTTINQAYLIKVAPPCDNLEFVNRIGLTSTASTVSARFDFVKVGRQWRCPIEQIRPVDYLRMRQDMRKEAEQTKAANGGNGT